MTDTSYLLKTLKAHSFNVSKKHNFKFMSVHKVIDSLCEPFDAIGAATKASENPNHEYFGMPIETIIELWNTKGASAADRGVGLDDYINAKFKHQTIELPDDDLLKQKCARFDEFLRDRLVGFNDIGGEIWMCSDKYGIRGRLDRLMSVQNNLVVFDWKNDAHISVSGRNQMLGPLSDYTDSKHVKYTLQVYIYKFILHELMDAGIISAAEVACRIAQVTATAPVTVLKPAFQYNKQLMIDIFNYAKDKQS